MYTIKELAEKTGVIPNAIRFYEKKGLLHPKRTEIFYHAQLQMQSRAGGRTDMGN